MRSAYLILVMGAAFALSGCVVADTVGAVGSVAGSVVSTTVDVTGDVISGVASTVSGSDSKSHH